MGDYEDLIQQARDGDETALDKLETDYSGGTLREKAESADEWRKKAEAAEPLVREARVSELVGKLSDELKEVGLTAKDFEDTAPDDLSLEMVKDRAESRAEASQATRLATAKDAGFETVEEYQEALNTVKEQKTEKVAGMEAVSGGVASGGGKPGDGSEVSRFDKGKTAYEEAKTDGRTDDVALANFIDVTLSEQSEPVNE